MVSALDLVSLCTVPSPGGNPPFFLGGYKSPPPIYGQRPPGLVSYWCQSHALQLVSSRITRCAMVKAMGSLRAAKQLGLVQQCLPILCSSGLNFLTTGQTQIIQPKAVKGRFKYFLRLRVTPCSANPRRFIICMSHHVHERKKVWGKRKP